MGGTVVAGCYGLAMDYCDCVVAILSPTDLAGEDNTGHGATAGGTRLGGLLTREWLLYCMIRCVLSSWNRGSPYRWAGTLLC
jgi:hypothetical protein